MGNGFKNATVAIAFKTAVLNYVVNQGCSYWGCQGAHAPTPTSILEHNKVQNSTFKYQGYCFLRMLRNYTDQKFHNFCRVWYNCWTIYGAF